MVSLSERTYERTYAQHGDDLDFPAQVNFDEFLTLEDTDLEDMGEAHVTIGC